MLIVLFLVLIVPFLVLIVLLLVLILWCRYYVDKAVSVDITVASIAGMLV